MFERRKTCLLPGRPALPSPAAWAHLSAAPSGSIEDQQRGKLMAAVEPTAKELFIGLADAEERLPDRWTHRRERVANAVVVAFVIALQLAWLAAFAYAAYRFL